MEQDTASTLSAADTLGAGSLPVRHFRQVLLWPLRLLPEAPDPTVLRRTAPPWQALHDAGEASPWREVVDEYAGDRATFHERH